MSRICSAVIVLLVNTEGVVSLSPPSALLGGQAASAYSPHCFASPASPCACAYPRLFEFYFPSEVKGMQIWVADITCIEPSLWNEAALLAHGFSQFCPGMRYLFSWGGPAAVHLKLPYAM